jgi:uncharacterized OsmC-like protein
MKDFGISNAASVKPGDQMKNQYPFVDPQTLADTVAAVRENPELGKVTFRLDSESSGGLRLKSQTGALSQAGQVSESRRGKYRLESDEPETLLGSDTAVSPAEYVLKALAGCYAVTLVSTAAERGIRLEKLALDLECDIDLNGFLGTSKGVRSGAQEIRVNVSVNSQNASQDEIRELIQTLEWRSPIRDTLANPVKVTTLLK